MCCISLHSIGLVIGSLESIGSLFGIIRLIIFLVQTSNNNVLITYSILIAIVVIILICSVLLIVGTKKNRHILLVPWLIIASIEQGTLCGLMIWTGLTVPKNAVFKVAPQMMVFLINGIFFYAIFSLFKHIQKIREDERPVNLEIGVVIQNKRNPY